MIEDNNTTLQKGDQKKRDDLHTRSCIQTVITDMYKKTSIRANKTLYIIILSGFNQYMYIQKNLTTIFLKHQWKDEKGDGKNGETDLLK